MSQTTKELKIICKIQVNNEGSAEGWVPSLPVAQVDNDEFEVVTDPTPTVSGITRATTVATVTTTAEHNFAVGQEVTIAGANEVDYNGTFTITAVPTETTFEYTVANSPVTPATGSITCVSEGDFLRIKSGVGYLRPKKKQVQVRWDKVGQPVSLVTHDIDFQDYGVTNMRLSGFPQMQITGGTIPAIGASDDFIMRFELWTNSTYPTGSTFVLLEEDPGNRLAIASTVLQFTNNSIAYSPGTSWPADAWAQIEIRQEDDGGYKLRIYKDGVLLQDLGAIAFAWDVAQPWKFCNSSIGGIETFVFSNLYIEHNGVIIVNEELRDGPGILDDTIGTGTPTYNTLKGNA